MNSDLTIRLEYSADIGRKKHDYASTNKGPMLKIGNDYELVTEIERSVLTTSIYYAHPYSAWERRTNEKQNSLIRCFFPKGKNLDKISEEQVAYVENRINNLPRKIFNYSTSNEIFESVLFDIAINL